MARENIRFSKPNFTTDGAFYYSMLHDAGVLQQKVDDGTVSFSFPVDTPLSETIKELVYDGLFFWSLEDHKDVGDSVDGFSIRKWAIDDFILKQIIKYDFVDDSTHTYRATSFALEYYRSSVGLSNDDGSGAGYVGVNLQDEVFLYDTSQISVGDILYFVKRWAPTHQRYGSSNIEQVFVNAVLSSTKVRLSSNLVGDPHGDGRGWRGKEADPSASDPLCPDEVIWSKFLWVFNEHSPNDESTPALYKINANNGSVISQDSGTQYGSIGGSAFYTKYSTDSKTDGDHTESLTFNTSIVDDSDRGGLQTYLVYIKGSSGLFYNVSTGITDRSLSIDNVKVDTISLWPSFDMEVSGIEPDVVLFRLQLGTTFKNSSGDLEDESWSTYNYDRTLLRRHVKSIALTATPAIVAITTGTSAVVAHLVDQYNESVPSGVEVSFVDDDSGASEASLTPTSSTTDAFGRAYTTFFAGGTEKDVKIIATSTWVDPS